jgi:hypothetical protein
MESPLVGCVPDVRSYNQHLLNTVIPSSIILPIQFVLQKPDTSFAVLVKTIQLPHNCWKFELVRDPCHILHSYVPTTAESYDMVQGKHTILVLRESSKPQYHKKLYKTDIWFDKCMVRRTDIPDAVPVLKLSSPHTVLSSHFSRLVQVPAGSHWRFPFEIGLPIPDPTLRQIRTEALEHAEQAAIDMLMRLSGRRAVTPPPERSSAASMPQHVINILVETALAKKECCPITQDELTKESMVVTPCGHGLDNSSASHWISTKHSCPVCRQPCAVDQLQKWSA